MLTLLCGPRKEQTFKKKKKHFKNTMLKTEEQKHIAI